MLEICVKPATLGSTAHAHLMRDSAGWIARGIELFRCATFPQARAAQPLFGRKSAPGQTVSAGNPVSRWSGYLLVATGLATPRRRYAAGAGGSGRRPGANPTTKAAPPPIGPCLSVPAGRAHAAGLSAT
jgi:hypothetical protein